MKQDSLMVLGDVERRLAAITTVDEAKAIRDQAEAIRLYAKKVKAGLAVQNRAAAIKSLAEVRAGELLARGGERRGGSKSHDGTSIRKGGATPLPDCVTPKQSHRWQAIATVPTGEILKREAAHTEAGTELTSRELYTKAISERREKANKRILSTETVLDGKALGVHHGDFREMAATVIPDNSTQLVFTDPPYDEDSLVLFEAAAEQAARVLVPGGSFLAYSGQKYLAQAMTVCAKHLTYWWLFALIHEGQSQLLQKLGVRCHWKPILWFVKKTRGDVTAIIPDLVRGTGREKDQHEWQQAEEEAASLIERLTSQNDLVVDFMAGSGTISAAAKRLQRRIVAFDTRADNVEEDLEADRMTTARRFGTDTPFEAWVRNQPGLSSLEPHRISVTDHDRTFHQYRAHTDCVGERAIDNIMIVELKAYQNSGCNVMTLKRFAQRDTLTLLQAFIGVGKRNRATGDRVLTRRITVGSEVRSIRFWGIHCVSMSHEAPDASESIWWNRRLVDEQRLVDLLGFRRHAYTLRPRDERRHHAGHALPLFSSEVA